MRGKLVLLLPVLVALVAAATPSGSAGPASNKVRIFDAVPYQAAAGKKQVRIWKILAAAGFADAGLVTNSWSTVTTDDIRPSVGMGLRALTPFGIGALEYAVPIRPNLGDDPRGRIHFYFAARAQF